MRLVIFLCIAACCLQGQPAKKPAAKKPVAASSAAVKPAPKVIQPLEIPKNAVEFEPGSFRHTDAQGNKWVYRRTPFGVARLEDKPVAPVPDPAAGFVKAVESGDSVRFERPGPFGTYRWERKKTELNETEKAAWERSRTAHQD